MEAQSFAGSCGRTHTMLPSTDFESASSANSDIPANKMYSIIVDILCQFEILEKECRGS